MKARETDAAPGEKLVGELEIGPPDRLAVGRGNAFVVAGYCYLPGSRTTALSLELDGERVPALHSGMPRQDVFERANAEDGERGTGSREAFRSGFVAFVPVRPRSGTGEAEIRLVATLEDGSEVARAVASTRLDPRLEPPRGAIPAPPGPAGSRVAICMATFNPPPELFHRQVESLREQTHGDWICLISDDGSEPELLEGLREEVRGDERFVLAANEGRLGFYNNFERALAMVPTDADFVTLCDQDDRWHPGKLERLLERMGEGVELAYSDARVVDEGGVVVHPSYWMERRNNYTNLGSLLIANTVTGAASLFRRGLLEDLLPFPPRLADPFHDHWLSLVALARGRISYVDEPLYDYVQHGRAVIGHSRANRRPVPVRERLRERLRKPGDGSRIVYFYVWSQQQLFARVLRMRCGERMTASKRRALDRFLSVDTSLGGLAWLLGRRLRRLWGRNETLDIERYFGKALLRRRAVHLGAIGRRRPSRWLPRDERIPPTPLREDSGGL